MEVNALVRMREKINTAHAQITEKKIFVVVNYM